MPDVPFKDESCKTVGACFDLKATGFRLGVIANFGQHPKPQYERIVRSRLLLFFDHESHESNEYRAVFLFV